MARIMENPYHITLQRVMTAMGAGSLGELAIKLDAPENTVRNWHKRNSVPFEWIKVVAKSTGRTIEWLTEGAEKNLPTQVKELTKNASTTHLDGDGSSPLLVNKNGAPTHLLPAGKQVAKSGQYSDLPHPKFWVDDNTLREEPGGYADRACAVPVYELAASAGNGSGPPPGELPEVHVSFSPGYMRRHFGRAGDGFAMIYVKGDSMQPGLLDGDEIVIDTRQRRVDRDGIYVITLRGDLKVKRIQQRLDGSLVVKSDNPAYEPELVTAAQAEEFTVEGRLVWPRLR